MPTIDGPPGGPEVHYFNDDIREQVLAEAEAPEVVEPERVEPAKKARKKD